MMRTARPGTLARFQDAFARALHADAPLAAVAPEVAALTQQPAFTVYRNTVMKGCIDALQSNFPAVVRLVGEAWFRAAAAVHARRTPPAVPALLAYGDGFPDFLAQFEPAAELPYLADVARLDRHWSEAHGARDAQPLNPGMIAHLDPGVLAVAVLEPHPAARWEWFAEAPIYTIWSRNRGDDATIGEIEWRAEGALLTRPYDTVVWRELDAAGCAFLDACCAGGTVADAAGAALAVQGNTDLVRLMSTLLDAGAFSRIHLTRSAEEPA